MQRKRFVFSRSNSWCHCYLIPASGKIFLIFWTMRSTEYFIQNCEMAYLPDSLMMSYNSNLWHAVCPIFKELPFPFLIQSHCGTLQTGWHSLAARPKCKKLLLKTRQVTKGMWELKKAYCSLFLFTLWRFHVHNWSDKLVIFWCQKIFHKERKCSVTITKLEIHRGCEQVIKRRLSLFSMTDGHENGKSYFDTVNLILKKHLKWLRSQSAYLFRLKPALKEYRNRYLLAFLESWLPEGGLLRWKYYSFPCVARANNLTKQFAAHLVLFNL